MKRIERIRHVLLAATFVTGVWATTSVAAELPATTAAQPTCACPPGKAATVKPVSTKARQTKLAVRRSAPIRLASRLYEPAIGRYFPLYLGIAY